MTGAATYPIRLRGDIDPNTSRWLWLLKWLLVIPHAVVLFFLWLAAFVMTVVAGFAILFTGRYPRGIFDVNVGVMRWTWRVAFYAINAFGTDRYPPFALRPDPAYPADLTVDYPERLSRGLVLIKWWLLAIPHYFIVAILAGTSDVEWTARSSGVGLIEVLAIIAAVILLVTGRYPRPLFDFLMGLNRWCYRVLGYVALMTDAYPPFRLDPGPNEPHAVSVDKPRSPDPARGSPPDISSNA